MEQAEPFKLVDCFYANEPVIDRWTFVFDEVNPFNGYRTMLATSATGRVFSQWTEGQYSPSGDNLHLGYRPRYIGEQLMNHVIERIGDV